MAFYNLGTIGSTPTKLNNYTVTTTQPSDIFRFSTPVNNGNFNLLMTDFVGTDANVELYFDANANRAFEPGLDPRIAHSFAPNGFDDGINRYGGSRGGTFFALVSRNSNSPSTTIRYDLYLSATGPSVPPNNLLAREVDLGNLNGDFFRTGTVGANGDINDTSDTFYFELGISEAVNIHLTELSENANMRLIRDFDLDRIVDANEVVASSTNIFDSNEFINEDTSGNYFLQVYATPGTDTFYRLDIDYLFG